MDKKIKILHVIPNLRKGGAERLVLSIFNRFKQLDYVEAKLVIFENANDYSFLCDGLDITVIPSKVVPSITKKWDIDTAAFDKFVKEFNPDIIHTHLLETEWVARINPLPGAAYISHMHSEQYGMFDNFTLATLFSKKKLIDFIDKRKLLKMYDRMDNKFISISSFITEYFEERFPQKFKNNIYTIYNSIEYGRFKNDSYTPPDASKTIKCVCVARLIYYKNQQFLIGVFKLLKEKGLNITLDIIGNGPDMEMLKQKIANAGLTDMVFLHGSINNVEDYLKNANIFTYSAIDGLFGISLLEALAAGLPFVALKGRADGDRLVDGVNGFIVEGEDTEQYVAKMLELINNPALAISMGKMNDALAKQHDIVAYTDDLINVYKKSIK